METEERDRIKSQQGRQQRSIHVLLSGLHSSQGSGDENGSVIAATWDEVESIELRYLSN